MPNIFISYRRSDSETESSRLYHRFVDAFGEDQVFIDRETLPLGHVFPKYLAEYMRWADVFIIVIGPDWLNARDAEGKRRLRNPQDYVYHEVNGALFYHRHNRVAAIPATVGGARIPEASSLPNDLAGLSVLSGVEIQPGSFDRDIDELIAEIQQSTPRHPGGEPPSTPPIASYDVNINEKAYQYGGPLGSMHPVAPDARVFLKSDRDGEWEMFVRSELEPQTNTNFSTYEMAPVKGCPPQEAVGAAMEWLQVDPEQCFLWREKPTYGMALPKEPNLFQKMMGAKAPVPEMEWHPIERPVPVYTSLRALLHAFNRHIAVFEQAQAIYPPPESRSAFQGYLLFGHLADIDSWRFGDYVCSLTTMLGAEEYRTHKLYYLPSVAETRLQFIRFDQEPYFPDTTQALCGHVGRDEKGFHIIYLT